MALVPCPECQREVSTEARACPQCAFPFPGRKASEEDHPEARTNTCPRCHGPISSHIQACPHCGVSLIRKPVSSGSRESPARTASARKVNLLEPTGIRNDPYRNPGESRRRVPLWEDPPAVKEDSPAHQRSKPTNSIIVGLILVVIVAMSVVFGAIWQLEGLKPLKAILYWRM